MSVNDDMFVSVSNAFSNFAVIMHPFRNNSAGGHIKCNSRFNTSDRYIHSLSVAGIAKNSTDSEHFMFVFAAERMSTMTPYVCITTIEKSTCVSNFVCTDMGAAGSHQAYFLIDVDTNGTYAYGFTSSFVFKLDIYANNIILNLTAKSVWPSSGFIPHAMDIKDTWAVIAGYGYSDSIKKNYRTLGCFINLLVLINAACTVLISETIFLVPSDVVSYNELYELSVAIHDEKVLIGVHRLESVVVLAKCGSSLNVTRVYTVSYPDGYLFGRVVDWAGNTSIAVLVQNPNIISWSKSQVFVYDENSVTLASPLFTFPNNQQILGDRLSNPFIARFSITIEGNMALLTENGDILINPIAPAGYASTWTDTTERVYIFYYEPRLCIGGTYKNCSSLGPCELCPPHTRNPGTFPDRIVQCIPCLNNSSSSFCPLASLVDIDLTTIPSYSQAIAYPESADTTDIEDLLIRNIFKIGSSSRCLIISPLFWTLIVSGLCIFIFILMIILKLCAWNQCIKCRTNTKNIFKHTDIIGEGERLTGGLATLTIVVLISFSYWFSASFIRRYPIEQVFEPAAFVCDQSLMNAQFSTGLEPLSLPKSKDAQPIFDLLDKQIFNVTVELINTGFTCDAIIIQENLIGTKYVPIGNDCIESVLNGTTSVTFTLSKHQTTLQMNITGPYWIGGIRLCIRGQGQISMNNILRQLDICQFYATHNETIGRFISLPFVFIKNINMTQPLSSEGSTHYSGLWMPTFTTVSLSDEAYYTEFGNYLRYTSSLTTIQIILDERPFFIKNIQQPIVRTAELIFHDLLFTSLCIELFALAFLLIKLVIIPLLKWIRDLWKKYHSVNDELVHSKLLDTTNSTSKIGGNETMPRESDSSLFNHQDQLEEQTKYSTSQMELNSFEIISRL
jgi:hypothetical protein